MTDITRQLAEALEGMLLVVNEPAGVSLASIAYQSAQSALARYRQQAEELTPEQKEPSRLHFDVTGAEPGAAYTISQHLKPDTIDITLTVSDKNGLADGPSSVVWMDCDFEGPAPLGYETWHDWMLSRKYVGVSVKYRYPEVLEAVEPGKEAKLANCIFTPEPRKIPEPIYSDSVSMSATMGEVKQADTPAVTITFGDTGTVRKMVIHDQSVLGSRVDLYRHNIKD